MLFTGNKELHDNLDSVPIKLGHMTNLDRDGSEALDDSDHPMSISTDLC